MFPDITMRKFWVRVFMGLVSTFGRTEAQSRVKYADPQRAIPKEH